MPHFVICDSSKLEKNGSSVKSIETLAAKPPPLKVDKDGVVRVGGTRVTLDTVVGAFKNGCAPEEILLKYLYAGHAVAYCFAGAGLSPADDTLASTDLDTYLRLPERDHWN